MPPPWPPVADADGPYTAQQCRTITLDGSGSHDPNGELYADPDHPWHSEIVSWEWDFNNDGLYDDASGETAIWSSCDLDLHVVGLKVTNSFGESDEHDTVIDVVELGHGVQIDIDIKPGSDPNAVNPRSKGLIPVAILTTGDFDAAEVEPSTVTFGTANASMVHKNAHVEDVDADGDLDLLLHFHTQDTGISCGDTEAQLTGQTYGGTNIMGSDAVKIAGCK